MNKFKIGIIGATGFATEKMLPQIKDVDFAEVVAIQGRNLEKVQKVASNFDVLKYVTDINEMLSYSDYDLIYIATPPYQHASDIQICLESGKVKNILCEKPIVLSEVELVKISELSKKYPDTKIYVGHHIRQQKAIKDLQSVITDEVIGDVVFAEGSWSYELDPTAQYAAWKLDQSKGGASVMGDPGIHVLDIMYALFGKPKEIKSVGSSSVYPTTFDNVTAVLGYDKKQVIVRASQTSLLPKNDLLIVGTKGRIEIPDCFSQTYITEMRVVTSEGVDVKKYDEEMLYRNEVKNIFGLYNEGIPATSFEEGINETRILLEINSQLK